MGIAGKLKKMTGGLATILLGAKYISSYKKNPVRRDTVFYAAHQGAGMLCGPYAIFRELMRSEDFRQYRHIWQINDKRERALLQKEYADYDNVSFVGKNSAGYFRAISSAGYLVINNTLPFFFTKKPGQVYVNTWHGIPLKTLGYDIPDGKYTARNMTRNFLQTDYLISPCPFMTKIYLESYKLNGIYTGKIIESGYPRNDLLLDTKREDVLRRLSERGTAVDPDKKIILYAPTWKGTSFDRADKDTARYDEFCDYLSGHIDTETYQILIKPHPMVYKLLTEEEKSSGRYVSQSVDTDELMSVTDILVSDYSSIFFDFLLTDRPIFFYIPDVESYREYRGMYFGLDDLPGPYSCDMSDIADWINDAENVRVRYAGKYESMKDWSCRSDDGRVSARVINAVFRGDESECRVLSGFVSDKKKRLLINGGSFAMNGVTTSLLTLLNMLDYEKYDVSLMVIPDERSMDNIMKVNDNVRVLCRVGQIPFDIGELIRHRKIVRRGLNDRLYRELTADGPYRRNYIRSFGGSTFDTVIDYSGYGITQPLTLMQCEGAKRVIWQHNDLLLDLTNSQKKKRGVYRRSSATPIESLVTLYDYFDEVVSCSEAIMQTNRRNLSTEATYSKFTFSTNPIDFDRIKKCSESAVYADGCFIDCPGTEKEKRIPAPDKANISFVTMGRFSPEKNHMNLIEGFAKLYSENQHCRLYIIGDGAMKPEYEEKISALGLEGKVLLTGLLENPFGVMRECGCFVLPSIYEGMGVVVYEARALGLAIIVSRFGAADAVCIPGGQLLTGHSSDELYQAMKAFADGKLTNDYLFDPEQFNAKALAEFEAVV